MVASYFIATSLYEGFRLSTRRSRGGRGSLRRGGWFVALALP
jgi:hypothetical protein